MIAKEGYTTVKASMKKDFNGAGCGCEGEKDGFVMRWMRARITAAQPVEIRVAKKESGCVKESTCCIQEERAIKDDACCGNTDMGCSSKKELSTANESVDTAGCTEVPRVEILQNESACSGSTTGCCDKKNQLNHF